MVEKLCEVIQTVRSGANKGVVSNESLRQGI
jgi:hypothetical protein